MIGHEFKIFAIGDQTVGQGKCQDKGAMSRSFVVIRKTGPVMTNLNDSFVEFDETAGTVRRRARRARPTFFKNGMKRVLREDVFDIGDEQLLVLLLMMDAEDDQGRDFFKKLLFCLIKKVVDSGINFRPISSGLTHGWSRN